MHQSFETTASPKSMSRAECYHSWFCHAQAVEEYTQQQKNLICYALGTLFKSIVKLFNNMKGSNDLWNISFI